MYCDQSLSSIYLSDCPQFFEHLLLNQWVNLDVPWVKLYQSCERIEFHTQPWVSWQQKGGTIARKTSEVLFYACNPGIVIQVAAL